MKTAMRPVRTDVFAAVLVCTQARWDEIRTEFGDPGPGRSQGREFVSRTYDNRRVVLLNAGEGIVATAAATQFAVDRWQPRILIRTDDAADELAATIEEVAAINDIPLLNQPLESGPLSDRLMGAFEAAGELIEIQNRTR